MCPYMHAMPSLGCMHSEITPCLQSLSFIKILDLARFYPDVLNELFLIRGHYPGMQRCQRTLTRVHTELLYVYSHYCV